ncbi:ArsR/SmtB family transcription factor [Microvirga sp. CF3016]|uniref:ArsR/SmtB family transcription factor n=1 Tax=Microvirga sp. CF3016 TaxID=3110181 RepID=UPI002E77CA5F|nr:metalloregulator ArsR/SmtB family transcription factor [Microvirga sp. CF3016]MEE1612686.1 metalloregulator ArsR/SmtB family transcription factor [Microvirga sp. CF3016]
MDERQAIHAFGSLAQETRLRVLRLLVQAGPDGIAAGAIAEKLGVTPSNISFHLSHLERAGLLQARREARSIIYSAGYSALRDLVRFLMEDCCAGDPRVVVEECSPSVDTCRP